MTIEDNLNGTGRTTWAATAPAAGPAQARTCRCRPALRPMASPRPSGVVVRWRVKSGSAGNPVSLRVLRPAGGAGFTGAGTSTAGTTNAGIADTTSRVSIRAGDSVGLNIGNSALVWANTAGANGLVWGEHQRLPQRPRRRRHRRRAAQNGKELLVQAVVEPDADGDGFGDETQDGCPGDAARQGPAVRDRPDESARPARGHGPHRLTAEHPRR